MTQAKTTNLAFLGCGFATSLHSKTLKNLPLQVGRFYASRDKKKAEETCEKFSGQGAFGSYEDALSSDQIDVALVATPPAQHLELTLAALATGKHVVVEKPPFFTSGDFDTVQSAASKAGKQVLIAENYFYKPVLLKLRNLLQSGVIGEVLFVHINALKEQKISDWRGDEALSGGGALFEGGIHWINFVANLGLKLKSARGLRPGKKEGMEKSVLANLEYEEGAVGTLYYSWETPSLFKGLRISKIYGRAGSITFESNGIFMIVRGKRKQIIFPGLKDIAGYRGMFTDFITALQAERPPEFNFGLAKQDLLTIEEIYKSMKSV